MRTSILGDEFGAMALCAGYQGGEWRANQFADHLFQWLPFAALSQESQNSFAMHNWVELVKLAAAHVYKSRKSESRGEIGELILHIACVTQFETVPVLCKLILKTSSNDTVKGFDGVHIRLLDSGDFELWLGESKFYKDPRRAIAEAVSSVRDHIAPSFLDTEKAMLTGHIAEGTPRRDELVRLFRSSTSSDELLRKSVFPILIAYNSKAVASFGEVSKELMEALETEVRELRAAFDGALDGLRLRFQLIFMPMDTKRKLVDSFDKKLEAFA